MKIVVIGGTGLIGSRLVTLLTDAGHEALAASPSSGVDAVTGAGLDAALAGAQVVVDVANAPVWNPDALRAFFTTASRNLLAAEQRAGVGHHVVLSIVGVDRVADGLGYFPAKVAQEEVVRAGTIPYTIVRATQFHEFLKQIIEVGAQDDGTVRLSDALLQTVAADDVAATLADVATGAPVNGVVELAGPETGRLDALGRTVLAAAGDPREVVTEPGGGYFGAPADDRTLVPDPAGHPRLGTITLDDALSAHDRG